MEKQQHERSPNVEVRNSPIHGTGVFATRDIKEGERIIEYVGEKVPSDEGTRRSEAHPELTYIFILNDDWDIDGSVGGNESKYINHSCDPNCEVDIVGDHIWIIAYKDIKEGEELTYDYSFGHDDDIVECRCGSPDCRGYINEFENEEQKETALRKRETKRKERDHGAKKHATGPHDHAPGE